MTSRLAGQNLIYLRTKEST